MTYAITHCTFADLESDPAFYALVDGYTRECAIPEFTPGEVQVDTYNLMEQAGALHTFAVRTGNTLVGFLLILLHKLPHFGVRTAVVESIYVDPEHRGGVGLSVVTAAKNFAAEQGVRGLLMSAPVGSQLSQLLPHLDFRHTNETFMWVPR